MLQKRPLIYKSLESLLLYGNDSAKLPWTTWALRLLPRHHDDLHHPWKMAVTLLLIVPHLYFHHALFRQDLHPSYLILYQHRPRLYCSRRKRRYHYHRPHLRDLETRLFAQKVSNTVKGPRRRTIVSHPLQLSPKWLAKIALGLDINNDWPSVYHYESVGNKQNGAPIS